MPLLRFISKINAFGLSLLLAVILGYAFPYIALAGSEYAFAVLFLLMFFAGFSIDWPRLGSVVRQPSMLLMALSGVFLFVPLCTWGLCLLLDVPSRYIAGVLFASAMPVAAVAPYFTQQEKGDAELAYALMVFSTLLSPLLAPLVVYLLAPTELPIQTMPLILNVSVFVLLPLFASAVFAIFLRARLSRLETHLRLVNSLCLGLLVFTLYGGVMMRVNFYYLDHQTLAKLIALAFFQDFGVYAVAFLLLKRLGSTRTAKTIALSLAMKNVAISAGILLFYDPQAVLPSALVFVAHAFFFGWLDLKAQRSAARA